MICGAYARTSPPMHSLCWPICGHLGPKSAYQSRFVGSCLGRTDFADFACLAHWRLGSRSLSPYTLLVSILDPIGLICDSCWPWLAVGRGTAFHRFRLRNHRRRPLQLIQSRRILFAGAQTRSGSASQQRSRLRTGLTALCPAVPRRCSDLLGRPELPTATAPAT